MIPEFVDSVGLPPGAHECTWEELVERFGQSERREQLCRDLRMFLERARRCGFVRIVVRGSFVTSKIEPGDLDLLFVIPRGMIRDALQAECAELLMNDSAFQRRFGHNALNCHDDEEVLAAMMSMVGYDSQTGKERGVLVLSCV